MKVSNPVHRTSSSGSHPLQAPGGLWEVQVSPGPQEVPPGIVGLQQLALQGRWREVVTKCRTFTATDTAAALAVSAFHILGLVKLRMVAEAAAELAKLGDLDDPQYLASKSHGAVSLAPFALRWLQAELPGLAGQAQESVTAMYSTMAWCRQQRDAVAAAGGGSSRLALWQERYQRAAFGLVGKHVRLRQHRAALTLLNELLKGDPQQPEVWSQVAQVQLSLGDVAAAQRSMERSAAAADHAQQQGQWGDRAVKDRALLLFVQQDFRGAAEQYSSVLQQDPGDTVAANNRALSLMYGGNLAGGIQSLEASFLMAPGQMMQESVVLNLASMYDLSASGSSLEGKRRMAAWVGANAPDDLDLACTKTALG